MEKITIASIKDKMVGTNLHLRCFPTHATEKHYARTRGIVLFSPLPPLQCCARVMKMSSEFLGGGVGLVRWVSNEKHGFIGQSQFVKFVPTTFVLDCRYTPGQYFLRQMTKYKRVKYAFTNWTHINSHQK